MTPRTWCDTVINVLAQCERMLQQMEQRINQKLEMIMSEQADIDAAAQAILNLVANIQAEDANLAAAVTAIQAFIAAHSGTVDTTALDAAVAQISGAQSNLDAAVTSVQGIVPAPPAPPAP